MRKLLLSVALLVVATAPVRAQDAENILNQAIKAQGDEKVAQSLQTSTATAKGTVSLGGMVMDFSIQTWLQLPEKSKNIIAISAGGTNIEITEVFTGKAGWASVMGMTNPLDDEQIKDHKDKLYLDSISNLVAIKNDKEIKIKSLGAAKVGDNAVVGIEVTKKDQRDIKLYFDAKTHLLLKTAYTARNPVTKDEVKAESLYSDHKEIVPGMKMAAKCVVNYDGEKFLEYEITEMRVVPQHDASIFAKPAQ
jgi:hypothetical protein